MASNANNTDFAPINVDANDRIPVSSKKSGTPSPQNAQGSNKLLLTFVFILAIVACGASAYLYTELQKSQATIAANQERVQVLENRLSATGEDLGNSTVALQVKLGELTEKTEELWDQMDRLWASAWRRNQEEIKELNSDVVALRSGLSKSIEDVTSKANEAQSSTQQLMTRINSINSKIIEQTNSLLAVQVQYEQFADSSAGQNSDIRELAEKIVLLERRNTSLLQKISEVEEQVKELTIKTI